MNSVPGVNCSRLKPDEEIDVYVHSDRRSENFVCDY